MHLRAQDDQAIAGFESLIKAEKLSEASTALQGYTEQSRNACT